VTPDTAACRAILFEALFGLRAIPAAQRDEWIRTLDARAQDMRTMTPDEWILKSCLESLRIGEVMHPAPPADLAVVALHLTTILHTVPEAVRQALIDELDVRTAAGETVTPDEYALLHVLHWIPQAERMARLIAGQGAPEVG
jgi:hypothetical protein